MLGCYSKLINVVHKHEALAALFSKPCPPFASTGASDVGIDALGSPI